MLKVLPYTKLNGGEIVESYLSGDKTIMQIAEEASKSIIEVKKDLCADIKRLETRISELKLERDVVSSKENSPKLQFEVRLYNYLFADGEEPKKLLTEAEIAQKLVPVLDKDKKFALLLSVWGDDEKAKIKEYARTH